MILDEFVEVKWHPINKKKYINKGYSFTKIIEKKKI